MSCRPTPTDSIPNTDTLSTDRTQRIATRESSSLVTIAVVHIFLVGEQGRLPVPGMRLLERIDIKETITREQTMKHHESR